MPGEETQLDDGITVEYQRGYIVLSDTGAGFPIYLDADAMAAFDKWRAELDADAAAQKQRGDW